MHYNYYFSPLAVALALGMASPVRAAEPMPLNKVSIAQLKQKFTFAGSTISASADSLNFISEHTDHNHITHIRMQQNYLGFPVHGGHAIFHSTNTVKTLAASQKDVPMNGVLYQGLQSELGKPAIDFTKNTASALQQFKSQYADKDISEEQATPMVYIDEQHHAHWAYRVSLFVTHKDKIPERPTAIVDAQTYKPFVQWNDVKTAKVSVKGTGFGGNHKTGEYKYGANSLPYLNLLRDESTEICSMENTDVKVIDMAHKYSSRARAMRFDCPSSHSDIYTTGYNRDGYDRDNGAVSPSNDALYAGDMIKHMYHDWYGVEALIKGDKTPMQLVMRVHYGEGYENAYWDGRQMTFGDGDTMMYPLVSLGVGGHEVSHGFTEQHSNLEYYGQSGGLNESFSDMAAQAVEHYASGKNSWSIGAEIMKEDSGYDALRYMDKPSRDGESIDSADEYYGGMDVHYSSGVYNHFFYILANKPNWDVRSAFKIMVKANMDYWIPTSTFEDAGCGAINAANDFGYSVDDVKAALTEVAISYESCSK